MLMLIVSLIQAFLLVPGVGEDRQFPLNQLPTLFLPFWYFFALAILLSTFVLIYKRKPSGYYLGILLSAIIVGTNTPDVLGFLLPSAPSRRTLILLLTTFPPALLLAYVSWRALQFRSTNI